MTNLSLFMINHYVMGFHISMHDSLAVAEVQSLQEFIDIKADVEIGETRVQGSKVRVVDIFEDQARRLALVVAHHIQQGHDVGSTCQVLENLDFTLDLLLFDGLEHLDDTLLVIDDIDALKHFRVLATTYGSTLSFLITSTAKWAKTMGSHI